MRKRSKHNSLYTSKLYLFLEHQYQHQYELTDLPNTDWQAMCACQSAMVSKQCVLANLQWLASNV